MARRIGVEIVGDSRSLERAFKRSAGAAGKFDKQIATAGKGRKHLDSVKTSAAGLVGGFVGVAAITNGLKDTITASSDLNEEISKSKVVFKDSSGAVEDWSKKTATGIGISQRQALEASGTFGNMLVPMGFARDKAAGMSTTMVDLAADMASFNNASPEDTLDALRSGLAGESEPLRKYGVFLSDARLRQEALSQGLKVGKGPLDALTKAHATYGLILKDTKDTQGDVQRTSRSYANVQRRLSAVVEDFSAKIGKFLLPHLTKAANAVTDWISQSKNQKKVLDTVKGAVQTLGTVVSVLRSGWRLLSRAVGGNTNAVKLLIGMYATFKVLTIAARISTLATSFRGLRGSMRRATGAGENLRGSQGRLRGSSGRLRGSVGRLRLSMIGKAGLAGAAVLAAYGLSKLFRKIPNWDKLAKGLGGSMYDLAQNLGLVNDEMAKFEGKAAPSQRSSSQIRGQARRLEARGLTPRQAANRLARQHPGVARRDIDVLAGVRGRRPTYNINNLVVNAGNAKQLEGELTRRSRRRPHPRRGS